MTMPGMNRTAVVFVALALFSGGCGTDAPESESDPAGDEAAAEVQAALEGDIDSLTTQVDRLKDEVRALRVFKRSVNPRFGRLSERMRSALESVRASVGEAKAAAGSSASESADALARAEEIARELAVLEQRYEVHMRRYHER